MDQPPSTLMHQHRRHGRRLLSLVVLLLSGGCGLLRTMGLQLTPPMPVPSPLRKQVLQGYMPFGSIGWVNNALVVFHGVPVGGNTGTNALYAWDLKTEPRKLLARSHNSCVSDGVIQTLQLNKNGEGKTFVLHGPEFKPQELPPAPPTGAGLHNPINCKWIITPQPLQEHQWWPLRENHGFLDFGRRKNGNEVEKVSHLASDLNTRRDTGIRMSPAMTPIAKYATHDSSYLIFELNPTAEEERRWIQSNKRTVWRLDQNLRGRPVSIPAGPWVSVGTGTIAFLPARPGVLITSNNFARRGAPGGAGLYLLPPNKPAQRLERGLVQAAAVSPDGCRVAYGFRPRLDTGIPEGGPRLVVLDLCDSPSAAVRR